MNQPTSNGVSRRTFLAAGAGAVLIVGIAAAAKRFRIFASAADAEAGRLNAWVMIDADGSVVITTHRAEMGQGAYSVVPQIVAEELDVDYDSVRIVVADGDNDRYGNQVTGGSSTVRSGINALLVAGATARDLLVRAAAEQWAVPAEQCRAERGVVYHDASKRSAPYGALVAVAASLKPNDKPPLKAKAQYKVIGQSVKRRDIPSKVNGSATYGIDFRLPGMRFAVVERSPRFEGRVKSFDASKAKAVPGVTDVVKVERDVFGHAREGVAVVATSTWAAMQGRKVLTVEWDDSGIAAVDSVALRSRLQQATQESGLEHKAQGNLTAALGADALDVLYETPYQAHACMEPLNCTAHVTTDRAEIWGPIQGPDWVRSHLAAALKLPMDKVTVHMTMLGGGFGRKAFMDYPHEAAMLSRAIGTPVQVVWTREDDLTAGPFRPGMTYRCRGDVTDGRVSGLEVVMAGQNMDRQEPTSKATANANVVEGLPEQWMSRIPAWRFADVHVPTPVPVMWWRSVYSSTNAFAFESFFDELARAANADPLDFRKANLDDARVSALLDRLAEVSGWRDRKPGAGYGMSLTYCFESYAAHVVKVARAAGGGVRIEKVWTVLDCGLAVNPDTIKSQIEGSIVMALGAAITHEMTFVDGRAAASNFDRYPMPKLADVPPIEAHVMASDAAPGGAGEPALPGVAPALANAIFDLTGRRHRAMLIPVSGV
ncbi:MAG: molybdopterin cofactor-binding domain-containing protein [Gemmatimonadaceae bacterium]|nr:molybdopterin cofactor-binding domain-containing protein [Gemmatimonadaceae bacterium]